MSQSTRNSEGLLARVDAVLFDLDGTLLDTARDLVAALITLCQEQAQPAPDPQLASRHVSTGAIGLVRLAFPGADAVRTEVLRQRLVSLYADRLCEHTVPYPGIDDVLEHLESRRIAWGVVTNKIGVLTEPLLQQLGYAGRCATIVSGDSTPERKPHPAPVQLALQQVGVAAARAVYIGDAPQDIAAGRGAGVITVAASWGYILPGQNPQDWQADYLIGQPAQLLELM